MPTYYVDGSSANASDSNSGTSIGSPLSSLAAINSKTFAAGDVIAFKSGDTFTGSNTNGGALVIHSSGTQDAPITIASYGGDIAPIIKNTASGSNADGVELQGS